MSTLTFDPDNTLAGGLYALSPREIIDLGIDLCAAVESGFGPDGCHGSIWPGNISLSDGRPVLGPAEQRSVRDMPPDALEYIAPEQFWNGENSPAADVYAIGLLLYTALNGGKLPFYEEGAERSKARAAALQSRMRGKTPPYPSSASRALGEVVLRAVSFQKEDRYANPAALRQALQALPEGAAVPAAVPVMPISRKDGQSAPTYKVDKEFEKTPAPKPKKEKKADPRKEEKEAAAFRAEPRRATWLIPLAIIAVAAIALVVLLHSCGRGENTGDPIPVTTPASVIVVTPPAVTPTPEPTPEPTPTPVAEATPGPTEEAASARSYKLVFDDVSWEQAKTACEDMGGHLATAKNEEELQTLITLAEQEGASFLWLGAFRGTDNIWYYVTGEPMTYAVWDTGEPSAFDADGTPENYLLMWHRKGQENWTFNDTRNDPVSILPRTYSGKIAYICQFD